MQLSHLYLYKKIFLYIFCVSNIKIRKSDYKPTGKCNIYVCEFSETGKIYVKNTVNQLEKIVRTNNGINLNKDLKFTVKIRDRLRHSIKEFFTNSGS